MMKRLIILGTLISASASASNIRFSRGITYEQSNILRSDLKRLKTFNFKKNVSPETIKVMGIKKLDGEIATKWLEERAMFIVGENFTENLDEKIKILNSNYVFEYSDTMPFGSYFKTLFTDEEAQKKGYTIMSNLGSAFYQAGKEQSTLYGIIFKSQTGQKSVIKLTSPRAGILQIGEGLFHKQLRINKENKNAMANSLDRISTLLHEARHSDGHAEHVGFPHVKCAEGHDFEGQYACDRNLNGPYSVDVVMQTEFIKNCSTCSTEDLEGLKLRLLDNIGRVIKSTTVTEKDLTEDEKAELKGSEILLEVEQLIYDMSLYTDKQKEIAERIKKLKTRINELKSKPIKTIEIKSKYLDPTPEGKRS